MIVYGIDPGPNDSGVVVFDTDERRVINAGEHKNDLLLRSLRSGFYNLAVGGLYIETIEPMGLPVGRSTLETMRWVGRFQEAYENALGLKATLVSRGDEKIVLCGAATFRDPKSGRRRSVTDAQIRQAIIDRFPATGSGNTPQVGTKAKPGPLYGVKGHSWSALAVVLTGMGLVALCR